MTSRRTQDKMRNFAIITLIFGIMISANFITDLLQREVIDKHNIKIASDDEVMDKVFMTDAKIFISFVSEKLKTIGEK